MRALAFLLFLSLDFIMAKDPEIEKIISTSEDIHSDLKEKISDFLEKNDVDSKTEEEIYEHLSDLKKNNDTIKNTLKSRS